MLKKDLITLGCIGIIILLLLKPLIDSFYTAAYVGENQEESIEENIFANNLPELSELEIPGSPGFEWNDENFVAEEDINISVGELNSMPCYYFVPPNNMDARVEAMVKRLFGNTDNLNREIEKNFGDGWGNHYNYTCDTEDGSYRLSGDSIEMTFMRNGDIVKETDNEKAYDKIMQMEQIIDGLQFGIYDKEGNSCLAISQVHDNKYKCSYVFNGIEASEYPYGASRIDGISYARLQPIEFEFKNNQISAIYHIISDKYESEEIIKNSYKGWDEILRDCKEEAERGYKEVYGRDYGNRYISLEVTGMKCVYEGGFINGKNAKLVAVPAVKVYVVEDIYSFENRKWERNKKYYALNLKTKEITSQYTSAWK